MQSKDLQHFDLTFTISHNVCLVTHNIFCAFQAKIEAGDFKLSANTSPLLFIIGRSKLHFNVAQ